MFEEAGFLAHVEEVTYEHDICVHLTLKVSHQTISPLLEVDHLLLPRSFRDVLVDSLENIQIVQSFCDD